MKKLVMVFVAGLLNCMANAYQDTYKTEENSAINAHCVEKNQQNKEYNFDDEHQKDIEDYDLYICDDAKAEEPSKVRIFFERMVGQVLIYYFTIKQSTSFYGKELKKYIYSWLGSK